MMDDDHIDPASGLSAVMAAIRPPSRDDMVQRKPKKLSTAITTTTSPTI
jgi:hypothetical protein